MGERVGWEWVDPLAILHFFQIKKDQEGRKKDGRTGGPLGANVLLKRAKVILHFSCLLGNELNFFSKRNVGKKKGQPIFVLLEKLPWELGIVFFI